MSEPTQSGEPVEFPEKNDPASGDGDFRNAESLSHNESSQQPPDPGSPRHSDDESGELGQIREVVRAEPIELQDSDFLPGSLEWPRRETGIPGPGLTEAALWTFGVLAVHVMGVIFTLVLVIIAVHGLPQSPMEVNPFLKQIEAEYAAVIYGGELSIFLAAAIVAAGLRLGRQAPRRLALTPIPVGHLLLILFAFLPLSLLCGQIQIWSLQAWEESLKLLPFLPKFDEFQQEKMLEPLTNSTPLPLLVLILAAVPAVGEELVFRGVIGRGLVARWGVPAGIIMTSILFALVHLHPAQAIALFPLAVFMHLLYLATRSLWAPVLLHFLNNSLAAVMLKNAEQLKIEALADESVLPFWVVLPAVICALAVGTLIWRTRVQYHLPDGTVWNPGYETAEQPPPHVETIRQCRRADTTLLLFAVISIALFAVAFVASAVAK